LQRAAFQWCERGSEMIGLILSVVPALATLVMRSRSGIGLLAALVLTLGAGANAYGQRQGASEDRIRPTDIKVRLGEVGPKFAYADVVIENRSNYTVASMMVSVYLDRSIPCAGFFVESQDIDCAHPAATAHSLHYDSKAGHRGGLGPNESVTYRISLAEWAKEKDTVGVVLRPTVHWVRSNAGK